MTLDQNSTSARLYKWLYSTNDLPDNLCPYFWKLVFAYWVIVPYVVIALPCLVMEKIVNKTFFSTRDSFGARLGIGVGIYFILWCIVCAVCTVTMLFIPPARHSLYEFMAAVGAVVWVICMVCGLDHLYTDYQERKWAKRFGRPYKPNLIVEFVKAKYGKYCPKINWK